MNAVGASAAPVPHAAGGASAWPWVLLSALAGGMGWGIRGQYGHETGAMMAGLLVGLTLVLLTCPAGSAWSAARAVAWCAVAMGFGGAMTYGQTIGLTQNASLVGRWDAWAWGMLGLSLKGGIWIGFAGVFLGLGMGGMRYRWQALLGLMFVASLAFVVGTWLFNSPFDPAQRVLPPLYFSADWRWEPGATLQPRRECWGGLLLALAVVIVYVGWIRGDGLALRLGAWGWLGGALGFPAGQSLQSFHAWNRGFFQQGFLGRIDPLLNWWNGMEIAFGLVFGAVLGLGVWIHRRRIVWPVGSERTFWPAGLEWSLAALHVALLTAGEFFSFRLTDAYLEFSLVLGLIPVVAVGVGRWWPWFVMMPITLVPIAGKTLRSLGYEAQAISVGWGWALYVCLPIAALVLLTLWCYRQAALERPARVVLRRVLLVVVWVYFGLNFAFFRFPWPWEPWTVRTPSALLLTVCAVGLTFAAVRLGPAGSRVEMRREGSAA
jgi:hypothetical protein